MFTPPPPLTLPPPQTLQMLLWDALTAIVVDVEFGDMISLPIALLVLFLAGGPSAALVLFTLPVTLR